MYVIPRKIVQRVYTQFLVVDDVLVAVRGIEIESPRKHGQAKRETRPYECREGVYIGVYRGTAKEDRAGSCQTENVLRVDTKSASERTFAVWVY
jgi:hypothetical protein